MRYLTISHWDVSGAPLVLDITCLGPVELQSLLTASFEGICIKLRQVIPGAASAYSSVQRLDLNQIGPGRSASVHVSVHGMKDELLAELSVVLHIVELTPATSLDLIKAIVNPFKEKYL